RNRDRALLATAARLGLRRHPEVAHQVAREGRHRAERRQRDHATSPVVVGHPAGLPAWAASRPVMSSLLICNIACITRRALAVSRSPSSFGSTAGPICHETP